MKKRRGIRVRVDGALVRFELNRKSGLLVRRGRQPQRVISFQDLYDQANGQPRLTLI